MSSPDQGGACTSITERFFLLKCVDPRRTLRVAIAVFVKNAVPATRIIVHSRIDQYTAQPIVISLTCSMKRKKKYISFHVMSAYKETSLATGGLVNCEKEYR